MLSHAKLENGMHRTWFKLLLNPILARFGWIIVSVFDENDKILGYEIRHYPENCSGPWKVWIKLKITNWCK